MNGGLSIRVMATKRIDAGLLGAFSILVLVHHCHCMCVKFCVVLAFRAKWKGFRYIESHASRHISSD